MSPEPPAPTPAASLLSFPVFLGAALAALASFTVRGRFNDPDLWWHLANGRAIWTTGAIPRTELFSYTAAGHPWIAHEWLSDLLFYSTWHAAAQPGLMLLLAALVSAFCILLYALGWTAGGNPKIAFLGALTGWLFGTVGFVLRPHMLAYLLLLAELILLERSARRPRLLWALPPLFALWVNLHPSHILGGIVLAVYWICSQFDFKRGALYAIPLDAARRRLFLLILPLSAAALLINPIGPSLVLYPFDLLLHQTKSVAAIVEWRPADLGDPRGLAMLAVCALIFLLVLLRRTPVRLTDLGWLATGLYFAVKHQRLLVVFGILAVPLLCRLTADLWENYNPARDSRAGNLLATSLALAAAVWAIPNRAHLERQVAAANPLGAIRYIRAAALQGPMIHDYLWGGYLMWAMPEHKVFIDGRTDVFDWTGVFTEYGRWATLEEDPRRLLDKYHVRFCLTAPSTPIAEVMPLLPGWQEVYRDRVAVVFVRTVAP